MVLAALLTPADFGTVAASTLVIVLAQILVGLGLGPAVVQRRTLVHEAASSALWLSLSVAGLFYAVLWITAPWLARLYQIPLVAPVVRVSGISLFLFSLGSIPAALLQRGMEFRKLFWVESVSQLSGVLSSLALAIAGLGVWALVLGPLVGATARTILALISARWCPSFAMDRGVLRPLLGFSLWIMGASFQSWLFMYADNLLAGYSYGAYDLGVYSLGFSLATIVPGILIAPLGPVAYPSFSILQADPGEVGRSLLKLQRLSAAILFPACFGLAALAGRAATLLYGQEWVGLGWTLGFLAIMPGAGSLWSLNAEAFRAVGRPDIWPKLGIVTTLILFPLLFLGSRFDYEVFVVARFIGAFPLPFLSVWFAARILRISIGEQWRSWRAPALCALIMFSAVLFFNHCVAPSKGVSGWLELLLMAGLGITVYVASLGLADRSLFGEIAYSLRLLGLVKLGR